MNPEYSFGKGLVKVVYSLVGTAIFLVAFTTFGEIPLWDLVVTYVKPILGSMTLIGLLKFVQNFIKVNYNIG